MAEGRVFRTLEEVKDAYFPNRPLEELEGDESLEELKQNIHKFIRPAQQETHTENK